MSALTNPSPPRELDRYNSNTNAFINLVIGFEAPASRCNCWDWGYVKQWNGGKDKPCELSEERVIIRLRNGWNGEEDFILQGQEAKEAREKMGDIAEEVKKGAKGDKKGAKGDKKEEKRTKVVNPDKAVWSLGREVYVFWVGTTPEVQTAEQVKEDYGTTPKVWWENSKNRQLRYKDW